MTPWPQEPCPRSRPKNPGQEPWPQEPDRKLPNPSLRSGLPRSLRFARRPLLDCSGKERVDFAGQSRQKTNKKSYPGGDRIIRRMDGTLDGHTLI
jgi:hypothetical protein